MNAVNRHRELVGLLERWREDNTDPGLLLHSCCAPCSSSCLELLTKYIPVTVFYYNPNITDRDEYEYRLNEQKRLISEMKADGSAVRPIGLIEGRYDPERYLAMAEGLEKEPERGPRCVKCYGLRLEETARVAAEQGFSFFATTLTLSPLKPAEVINTIGAGISSHASGQELADGINSSVYLPTDFKKGGGYQRSVELSKKYSLYRQDYCGCIFSRRS